MGPAWTTLFKGKTLRSVKSRDFKFSPEWKFWNSVSHFILRIPFRGPKSVTRAGRTSRSPGSGTWFCSLNNVLQRGPPDKPRTHEFSNVFPIFQFPPSQFNFDFLAKSTVDSSSASPINSLGHLGTSTDGIQGLRIRVCGVRVKQPLMKREAGLQNLHSGHSILGSQVLTLLAEALRTISWDFEDFWDPQSEQLSII